MWTAVATLRLLVLVPVAYGAACYAAGLIVTFVVSPIVSIFGTVMILVVSLLSAWIIAMLALVPMLVLVAVAEVRQWRAWYVWVPAGAAIGLLFHVPGAGLYADLLGEIGVIPTRVADMIPETKAGEVGTLTVVGGLLAGLVYWSIAGRYSGLSGGRGRGAGYPARNMRDAAWR